MLNTKKYRPVEVDYTSDSKVENSVIKTKPNRRGYYSDSEKGGNQPDPVWEGLIQFSALLSNKVAAYQEHNSNLLKRNSEKQGSPQSQLFKSHTKLKKNPKRNSLTVGRITRSGNKGMKKVSFSKSK